MTARRRRLNRGQAPRAQAEPALDDHEKRIRHLEVPYRVATFHIKVFGDEQELTLGDNKFIFEAAEDMDGMKLKKVEAFVSTVSSSGDIEVLIRNVTQAVNMLSDFLQIDEGTFVSKDSGSPYSLFPGAERVAWGDLISIDVGNTGTGAMGLGVILEFR